MVVNLLHFEWQFLKLNDFCKLIAGLNFKSAKYWFNYVMFSLRNNKKCWCTEMSYFTAHAISLEAFTAGSLLVILC